MIVRSLIFLFFFKTTVVTGARYYFVRCGLNGFSCESNATKVVNVTFECPKNINDAMLYINQFTAPQTIEKLEIRNCHTLTLATRCSGENKRIRHLRIANIQKLIFQRTEYESMLPQTVIFENISHIQEIPPKTFGQIQRPFYSAGCYGQPVDFQNLYFKNVSIDTIQSNAFVGVNSFNNFSFVDVDIKTIHTSGIKVKMALTGVFEIKNSKIGVIEHLGIQMYTKRSIFTESQFTDIDSGGINGTAEDFYFTDNFVETLHSYGFSILATNIFILKNSFLHLKSSALEKLSPGLLQDSGRNFGKLKFIYDFSKNALNFIDAGSLNPDYVSYENVQTDMMFSRNTFLCSCENLGWLFSNLGHGPNTAQVEPFYEMVLDESYANTCVQSEESSCELPVKKVGELVKCGKCLTNVSIDDFCQTKVTAGAADVTSETVILSYTEKEEDDYPEKLIIHLFNETIILSDVTKMTFSKICFMGFIFIVML